MPKPDRVNLARIKTIIHLTEKMDDDFDPVVAMMKQNSKTLKHAVNKDIKKRKHVKKKTKKKGL